MMVILLRSLPNPSWEMFTWIIIIIVMIVIIVMIIIVIIIVLIMVVMINDVHLCDHKDYGWG